MSYWSAMTDVVTKRLGIFIIGVALFGVGFFVGRNSVAPTEFVTDAVNIDTPKSIPADFSDFWKVWNIINEKYYDAPKAQSQEKVWGAISGLVASLGDPYTIFLPPKEAEFFNDMINGSFGGVGMEIGEGDNGAITVIAPLKGTPAERAGIRSGDIVVKIDDESTTDMSVDVAVGKIRGDIGSTVHLTLSREGEAEFLELDVTREAIEIPTLATEARKDGIFVITLYSFDAQSSRKMNEALKAFVKSGDNKLILDLRGNPGGILGASVDIASYFVPEGAVVVSEKSDQGRQSNDYRSLGYQLVPSSVKMIVLVDKGSASASEILAGALQEHKRALLVGEQTFGKGSVQELIPVTGDTSVKITVGKWFTPNGISISDGGLTPDVPVARTEDDFKKGIDPQLNKAVELLLKK